MADHDSFDDADSNRIRIVNTGWFFEKNYFLRFTGLAAVMLDSSHQDLVFVDQNFGRIVGCIGEIVIRTRLWISEVEGRF